jgi:serine/threonine protein kinase
MSASVASNRDPEIQRLLDQALDDQKSSWTRGERIPVEDYLRQHPALQRDTEAMLDLIYQEYLIRQDQGETPRPDEFYARFPDLAESLMLQFGVDAAIPPTVELQDKRDPSNEEAHERLEAIVGYEILNVLGRGGMGIVYKARDQNLGRIVAIKTIAEGQYATSDQRERFQSEAHAVARLRHPNIIAIYAVGEQENRPYLSLEFAEGGSLAQRLADKPMAPREAAAQVEVLARAVHAAHQAGVVHRDLKPSNVLLTADGVPKVSDFGLAKLLDNDSGRTLSGQVMGTPSYIAPEQAEGHSKQVGPAADTYAMGAILYHALTGRPPFLGESAIETLKLVTSTEVVAPRRLRPDVPRDLDTICLKCLEKTPGKRYATALDLAEDLGRFQRGEPILPRRIGPIRRFSKWTKRHPWQTASAAIGLIAVSAIIGLTYRHNVQLSAEVKRTAAKAAEASRNYQEARNAIQAMLTKLNDRRLAGSPRLIELRRDLQEDALAFYNQILVQNDSNDPIVRADTARALLLKYALQHALGHGDQAENSVRRAVRLVEGLRSEQPDDIGYMVLQVDCLVKFAACLGDLNQRKQIINIGRQSVELAERVAKATPDDVGRQADLAMCHNNLGNSFLVSKNASEAMVHYQEATKIRRSIDRSKLPAVTLTLAQSLMNEGVVLWSQFPNPLEAEKRFQEAELELLSIPPDHRDEGGNAVITLGKLHVSWGGMLMQPLRRLEKSIARSDKGLQQIEPYLRIEPNDAEARAVCLKLHGNRGMALGGLGKHRESVVDWTHVVELSTQPVPPDYRIQLAIELIRAGELVRASAQVQLVQAAADLSGKDRYNLGAIFALCATAVRNDLNVPCDQRLRLVNSHISDALHWLRTAAKAGFFRDPAMRAEAKKDPDLEILRNHPEFRQLIEAPAPKPANKVK